MAYHSKNKMKVKKKAMPGGGKMPMMPGGGKMPMYMYGGKVFKDGGSLVDALAKDPAQLAKMKKAVEGK